MALQVWLPLNGNLDNQGVKDYSLSIARGAEVYDNNGKIGKCFHANGVNTISIENIIPDFYNYTGYSLCAWFCVEAQNTAHTGSAIISAGNWNSQVLNLAVGGFDVDHYAYLYVSGTSWGHRYLYEFKVNSWYHVVVCSDGVKTYAYVNGQLLKRNTNPEPGFLPTNILGDNIYIGGATYSSGMQFFGKINDVRIYDHCLSPKEVSEIAKGLVLHYKLDDIPQQNLLPELNTTNYILSDYLNRTKGKVENGVYYVEGWQSDTVIDTSPALKSRDFLTLEANTDYYLGFFCREKNNSLTYFGTSGPRYTSLFDASNVHYYPLESVTVENESGEYVVLKLHTGNETQYKLYLGFDTPNLWGIGSFIEFSNVSLTKEDPRERMIGSSNIIPDCSGYNRNGTINGTLSLSTDSPRYDNCTGFDSNTYIQTKSPSTEIRSVSLWAKWNSIPARQSVVFVDQKSKIGFGLTSTGILCSSAGVTTTYYRKSLLSANAWYHFVIVNTGTDPTSTTRDLYINGVKQTLYSGSSDWNYALDYLQLGKRSTTSDGFNGQIADFRMYATALSAQDIQELYNTSAYVDNKQNMECFEIREDTITETQITKRGQIECNTLTEETEASIDGDGNIECNQIIEI